MQTSKLRRASSAHPNYRNIQLHACLDEARMIVDKVTRHLKTNQYENHVLDSAERGYKKDMALRPTSSATTFKKTRADTRPSSGIKRGMKTSSSLYKKQAHLQTNPQTVMSTFQSKTLRVSVLKGAFQQFNEQQLALKRRIAQLRTQMAKQKTKKYKISLRNSGHMNNTQAANYHIDQIEDQRRRVNLLIDQTMADNQQLRSELRKINKQQKYTQERIGEQKQQVGRLQNFVHMTRRQLSVQRGMLQMLKEDTSVSMKMMHNDCMEMNMRKEEKALLLNYVDDDHKKVS